MTEHPMNDRTSEDEAVTSQERLEAYFEDLERLRSEAEARGDEELEAVRARLEQVAERARAVEREYDEQRAVPDAGRRLSRRLTGIVEELGERIDEAWERLRKH
ncbi:MAG: hypothetical protein ACF8XB_10720 [Planctomycetota bacterium JB042]